MNESIYRDPGEGREGGGGVVPEAAEEVQEVL